MIYGSRGSDNGALQFILYGLVGFVLRWPAHGWRIRRSISRRGRIRRGRAVERGFAERGHATCASLGRYPSDGHVEQRYLSGKPARSAAGATFRGATARGPVIDQDGREIPQENPEFRAFQGFRFDFGHSSANPFGNLTREQRLARLDALARLLDVAFILPGTNIRYGVDGIVRLIPVVGDLIASAFSLWLVREARTLGAPWHVTARMLANVALEGTVGMVPIAGDAFECVPRQYAQHAAAAKLDGKAAALIFPP